MNFKNIRSGWFDLYNIPTNSQGEKRTKFNVYKTYKKGTVRSEEKKLF